MAISNKSIEYILEVKARKKYNYAQTEILSRLSDIEVSFETVQHNELLRYFPLALIAVIESATRMLIVELIDSGDPYLSRSEKLLEKTKIDFQVVKHLHGKNITIGEFIAHYISINQLSSIDAVFTTLIDKKILQELAIHHNRFDFEILQKPKEPILKDYAKTYNVIDKLFEIRHILAHESATTIQLEKKEIQEAIVICKLFLEALFDFIGDTMYPNAPLTQTDMNISACEELKVTLDNIKELNIKISDLLSDENIDRLNFYKKAQEGWENYMELESDFKASSVTGGTMWPLIKASSANRIAIAREYDLKQFLLNVEYEI